MPSDEKKNTEQSKASEVEADVETQASSAELDFEDLDLTVEHVEERISPSETNVFDK